MGMTGTVGNAVGKRRHRRHGVMADINVTPMVDVMLVLLIVFMVSAPLLTVGVPVDLPQTQAKSLEKGAEPLVVSVTLKGDVFLQSSDTPIALEELVPKLKAVTDARGGAGGGLDERIYVRADRKADWGAVMRVMGRLSAAGFRKVALVTEVERGS
jgi:biopolymer transport protein TolR